MGSGRLWSDTVNPELTPGEDLSVLRVALRAVIALRSSFAWVWNLSEVVVVVALLLLMEVIKEGTSSSSCFHAFPLVVVSVLYPRGTNLYQ